MRLGSRRWPALLALLLVGTAEAETPPIAKPGIPALQRPADKLHPAFVRKLGRNADWVQITARGAWVAATGPDAVDHVDARTGRIDRRIPLPGEACAGLALGFGSLWVPLCGGAPRTARIDLASGKIAAILPFGPPEEGGIAASRDSIWLATDSLGSLARINPRTNSIRQTIKLASGSTNPVVDGNALWITSVDHDQVTKIDVRTGRVLATAHTGPSPRFLTVGAGSVWTLNQGDGTVTRISADGRRVQATVKLGIPGHGGDIHFGGGRVWATSIGMPLTVIDPRHNQVVAQWVGKGGDSLGFGHRSIWLTDYRAGLLARLPVSGLGLPR